MARAAFDEAVRRRPGKTVVLRQKSPVLAERVAKALQSFRR